MIRLLVRSFIVAALAVASASAAAAQVRPNGAPCALPSDPPRLGMLLRGTCSDAFPPGRFPAPPQCAANEDLSFEPSMTVVCAPRCAAGESLTFQEKFVCVRKPTK